MTVQKIYINGESIREEQLDLADNAHRQLLYGMILNNDSSIVDGKGIGDPTEYALIESSRHIGLDENLIRDVLSREEEVPFDSDRKMMSTKYRLHGVEHVLTKGALDSILDRCISITDKNGVRPITEADKKRILDVNTRYSEEGLRVLAFAYKESDEALTLETEQGYTFIGLVSMIDPPREESRQAVADAIRAGIKPIMITGDHKVTASAIARQIGIMRDGDISVTGMELDAMSDDELDKVLEKISVYARVSPENKIRIVEAWQRKGNIVSMTGDGVNDAPALKKADIGVAMGITGTEVSKDAASMILQDDNFATIIKAVANGRNVYRNIKNSILFLLSGNMAAIITVLFASVFALPMPFMPVHLLFINLLTDSLPAIAIGMEPPEDGLLSQKPRDPKEGILTKQFTLLLFLQGALIAVAVIRAFYIGLESNAAVASTMAFATLTLARLFHGFNCRSEKSIISIGLFSNPASIGAFILGLLLLTVALFVPGLHSLFSVTDLTGQQIGTIIGLALTPTLVIQVAKLLLGVKKK
ncbi:MAG: cation-translocating P-type ATPase, partial [Ruminococcus sp.]|nr:cation-translocating P-type ATPase [Ruminococcus sp.]